MKFIISTHNYIFYFFTQILLFNLDPHERIRAGAGETLALAYAQASWGLKVVVKPLFLFFYSIHPN